VPNAGAAAEPDAAAEELLPKLDPAKTPLVPLAAVPAALPLPAAAAAKPPVLALLTKPKAG
jgi:hypothetical protein